MPGILVRLRTMRLGLVPDIDVDDSATWSAPVASSGIAAQGRPAGGVPGLHPWGVVAPSPRPGHREPGAIRSSRGLSVTALVVASTGPSGAKSKSTGLCRFRAAISSADRIGAGQLDAGAPVPSRTRRRVWAFDATTIVDSDISTAPTAGLNEIPAQASTPAANGNATTL